MGPSPTLSSADADMRGAGVWRPFCDDGTCDIWLSSDLKPSGSVRARRWRNGARSASLLFDDSDGGSEGCADGCPDRSGCE